MNQFFVILLDHFRNMTSSGIVALLFIVVVMGGGMLVGLITALAKIWAKHERSQTIFQLKSEMIGRGMSAEEIERVLAAEPLDSKRRQQRLLRTTAAAERN